MCNALIMSGMSGLLWKDFESKNLFKVLLHANFVVANTDKNKLKNIRL